MLKGIRTLMLQIWPITRKPIVTQLLTIVIEGALLLLLFYLWQADILTAEKGLYSPFQSGLSLIRYLGLVVVINFCISIAAIRRDTLWIWLPLVSNSLVLGLALYYIVALTR